MAEQEEEDPPIYIDDVIKMFNSFNKGKKSRK